MKDSATLWNHFMESSEKLPATLITNSRDLKRESEMTSRTLKSHYEGLIIFKTSRRLYLSLISFILKQNILQLILCFLYHRWWVQTELLRLLHQRTLKLEHSMCKFRLYLCSLYQRDYINDLWCKGNYWSIKD